MRRVEVLGRRMQLRRSSNRKKAFLQEPEADESGGDSSDDESEPEPDLGGQSGAHHEVPAVVRKLYDSFTVAPQPITQSRSRSGCNTPSPQAPMRAVDINRLPPEPTTLCGAQASPEWPNWQRARKSEMDGQLARQASIRMMLGIAAVKNWRTAKRALLEHEGRLDPVRRNTGVKHQTVGMCGRRFCHLPKHSTRSVDSRGCRR